MKTKRFIKQTIDDLRISTKTVYVNKYFNLFLSNWEWNGLSLEQSDYIMRKFWANGTVAAFPIKFTDEIGFTAYAVSKYNMYDFPEVVNLVNKWQVPFIPITPQIVNKDVVIGWAQSNHKPINLIVDYYIDRMVQVDMVINTNLQVHKMPFVIGITPTDTEKAQDVIDRILNNEIAVFMDSEDLNMVKSFATGTPYIIDKLYSYKTSLENELLTFLGIDNASLDATRDRLIVDEVNANNAIINLNKEGVAAQFKAFSDNISKVLNYVISAKAKSQTVTSVHEDGGAEDVIS